MTKTSILSHALARVPTYILSASTLFFFSGCGWLQQISELDREVTFSATITPAQIYEGQQAKVQVNLSKNYEGEKIISWTLYEEGTQSLATTSDFVEVQGSVSLSGTSAKDFTITSKPGSIASGSKQFKVVLTTENSSQSFNISVLDSGTTSTISITSALNSGYVNNANKANYTVSGVCSTAGSDVNLVAEIGGQSTSGVVPCSVSLDWSINLNFSAVTNDGPVTLSATHAGGGGTLGATSLQIQKDVAAPTVAFSSPGAMSAINASMASSFAISGTCSEYTRIVSATLTSSGGGTPVVASGVCLDILGSGEWSTTANISSLTDGTITATLSHSDAAGNTSSGVRAFTKDTLIPTLSITSPASLATYNASTYQALAIGGACNKNGATVTLTGDVSGTLTATCNGTSYSFSGLTLTGANGVRAVTATISDTAGNQTQTSINLQKDILVPTLAITSPASMTMYNASTYQTLAITGTCNKNGATVALTGDVSGTLSASCNGTNFSFSGLTLTGATGTRTITATISDSAGNSSQVNLNLQKDIVVPTLAISSPASLTTFIANNYTSVAINGTCNKNGATVTLTGDVSGTLTDTCNGTNYSFTGLTLTGTDGLKSVTATIADSAGNSSQVNLNLQKDISVPTAILSGAPAPGSYSNATSLTVTVGGADVSEYLYKFGDGTTDCTNATGYSAATGIATTISINAGTMGADGAKKLCVRAKDASGNIQSLASATEVGWTKDTALPTLAFTSPAAGSYVNLATQSSFAVSGTCSEVGTSNVNIDGDITAPVQVNCVAGAPNTWTANVNFSTASNGPVFLLISQTDAAGNVGSRTRAFVKDAVNPTIGWTTPSAGAFINNANKAAFAVTGTCSDYSATPNVALTSTALTSTVNVACDGANWTANLAFNNGDEAVTVRATITDAAGNSTYSDRNFSKDTNNPVLAITSPSAGSYVNDANKAAFAVSGTCSDVGTNNVVVSGSATATVNCVSGSPNTWSANLNFTAASDGALSITVTHTDAAGNTHAPTLALNKDVVAPTTGWTLPLAAACASNSSGTTFAVSGTCTNGDGNVTLSSAQLGTPVATSCTGGTWSATLNLNVTALADLASFSVQASQTDTAGNTGALSRSFKKIGSAPTVILGGWDDIYSVGPKTYASNPSETTPNSEPGQVRISWKEWPAGNTCMPEAVKVYRASIAGGGGSLVSNMDFPSGIPANVRSFTDNTLQGATIGTVGSPTDFGKGWYYTLRVTIAGSDYNVTSPTEIAEARVVAPPVNMALVHRWIANQEVCGLMSRTPDAANHYRCSYSGWGKITGNYYDLEKDLLVDRHELGCNFTSSCGAGGNQPCLASVFSTTNPAGAGIAGADGQVFYNDDGTDAQCFIKIAGTWRAANTATATVTLPNRLAMSTAMAGKPPLTRIDQPKSYDNCQAYSVTLDQVAGFTSANKRLLRNKEWKAAAAWSPTLTDAQIVTLENGGALGRCNTSNAHGLIATDRGWVGTYAFYSGSQTATASCQSRYGIQDMVGNVWEWTSDQLGSCSGAGSTCVGVTSAVDAGNTDMNGFPFDHVAAPGNGLVSEWTIESKSYGANYFSVPLGIPMITNDGGNAISIDSWLTPTNKFHGDRFYLYPTNGNVSRGLFVGGSWGNGTVSGRWASAWSNTPASSGYNIGLRCAVPLSY
ncbi:MAG: SUMF1/EgtB/PvdO family nonheme iron enzyme [Bdellovibrionaceae bacterium]|nr:SUMF1/EgtB/PvdO family nonheme iron enzyme [Pseudobdellovibrionaceae bacterium]